MPRQTQDTETDTEHFDRMRRLALKALHARERYGEDEEHREAKRTQARERYRQAHPDYKPHRPRVSAQIAGTLLGGALLSAPIAAVVAAAVYLSG
jgi:hypothetical protein